MKCRLCGRETHFKTGLYWHCSRAAAYARRARDRAVPTMKPKKPPTKKAKPR